MSNILKIGKASATINKPLIAVSMLPENELTFNRQIETFNTTAADVVEWRLDAWRHLDDLLINLDDYLRQIKKPLILTYRTRTEGGLGDDDLTLYMALYQRALEHGVAAIDIEAKLLPHCQALVSSAKTKGTVVIVSRHIFEHQSVDLASILMALATSQADVIKLALQPINQAEVAELLAVTEHVSQKVEQPLITMAMGELGQITRKIGYQYGSQLTFASLFGASASGQLALRDMLNYFN